MRTPKYKLWFAVACLSLLLPLRAFACACCANDGEYHINFKSPSDYELGEMKRMRLGRSASLFLTEAGLEVDALGIFQPRATYQTNGSLVGSTWKFNFGSGASTGVLELPLPEKMLSFSADIHDGKLGGGGGPLLYKEWRFEGTANGNGIFRPGFGNQVKYFLVLQGRGNGCDNAEDFTNWRLEIRGDKAKYAFFGRMGRATK